MDFAGAVYWRAKQGALPEEYEDAWCGPTRSGDGVRAAVADGATESAFAGLWARLLADGLVREGRGLLCVPGELRTVREEWNRAVSGRLPGRPWYVLEKAEQGAFAAALLLELLPDGEWSALAVGDCCLFQVRGRKVLLSWPFDNASGFGNRPELLGSRDGGADVTPLSITGVFSAGDTFLLATDALAAHLFQIDHDRLHQILSDRLERLASAEPEPRNDDLTLMRVEVLSLP